MLRRRRRSLLHWTSFQRRLLRRPSRVLLQSLNTWSTYLLPGSCFPRCFKTAQVQPRVKKPGLEREDFANFRTTSNLNTISKVMERSVPAPLCPHLTKSTNFNQVQSAYYSSRSTETALLKMFNDIYKNIEVINHRSRFGHLIGFRYDLPFEAA